MSKLSQNSIEGIIIRTFKAKDADLVIHLLTKDGEQLSAIAHGVRKVSSRKAYAVDLCNQVRVKLNTGFNLPTVSEIKLTNNYPSFKKDGVGLMFVQFICELSDVFSQPEHPEPGLYNNIINLLSVYNPKKFGLLAAALVLRYLNLSGNLPRLDDDILLSGTMETNTTRYTTEAIGYTSNSQSGELISSRIYKVQKFILRSDFTSIHKLDITQSEELQLLNLHLQWLEISLGVKLRTSGMFIQSITI